MTKSSSSALLVGGLLAITALPKSIIAFSPPTSFNDGRSTRCIASSSSTALSAIDPASLISDPTAAGAVGAAVAAVAAALGLRRKSDSDDSSSGKGAKMEEVEEEKIDVSIPYDAAAALAYDTYLSSTSPDSKPDFDQFKTLYEDKMVAEVKLKVEKKKMEQKLKDMEGEVESMQKDIDKLLSG